jgi:hypothetical protein
VYGAGFVVDKRCGHVAWLDVAGREWKRGSSCKRNDQSNTGLPKRVSARRRRRRLLIHCGRHGTRSSCRTGRKAITASSKSPPPLKFDAIGVKLQAPLGGSSEGRVTSFCLLVTSFELVGIVFPLASEFLWRKTRELPLKLCELLLNISELPH